MAGKECPRPDEREAGIKIPLIFNPLLVQPHVNFVEPAAFGIMDAIGIAVLRIPL